MSSENGDPDWTLGWRLRRSLEHGGIDIADMAEMIEVHRTTISRWLHDEVVPKRVYLREWADQTGVRLEWLTGEQPPKASGPAPRPRVSAGGGAVTDNRGYEEKRRRPKEQGSPDRPHRAAVSAFNHSYQGCGRLTDGRATDRSHVVNSLYQTFTVRNCRPLDFRSQPTLSNHDTWWHKCRKAEGGSWG